MDDLRLHPGRGSLIEGIVGESRGVDGHHVDSSGGKRRPQRTARGSWAAHSAGRAWPTGLTSTSSGARPAGRLHEDEEAARQGSSRVATSVAPVAAPTGAERIDGGPTRRASRPPAPTARLRSDPRRACDPGPRRHEAEDRNGVRRDSRHEGDWNGLLRRSHVSEQADHAGTTARRADERIPIGSNCGRREPLDPQRARRAECPGSAVDRRTPLERPATASEGVPFPARPSARSRRSVIPPAHRAPRASLRGSRPRSTPAASVVRLRGEKVRSWLGRNPASRLPSGP